MSNTLEIILCISLDRTYQTSSSNPYLISSSSRPKSASLKSCIVYIEYERTFNLVFTDIDMSCRRHRAGSKVINHSRCLKVLPFDVVGALKNRFIQKMGRLPCCLTICQTPNLCATCMYCIYSELPTSMAIVQGCLIHSFH